MDIEHNPAHAVMFLLALIGAVIVLKKIGEAWDKKQ